MKYIPIPINKYTNFRYDDETYKKYKRLYDCLPAEVAEKVLSYLDKYKDLKDVSKYRESSPKEILPVKSNETKYGYHQEGKYDYDSDFSLYDSSDSSDSESEMKYNDIFDCEI
jgi:hypothetical protein